MRRRLPNTIIIITIKATGGENTTQNCSKNDTSLMETSGYTAGLRKLTIYYLSGRCAPGLDKRRIEIRDVILLSDGETVFQLFSFFFFFLAKYKIYFLISLSTHTVSVHCNFFFFKYLDNGNDIVVIILIDGFPPVRVRVPQQKFRHFFAYQTTWKSICRCSLNERRMRRYNYCAGFYS